MVYLDGLFCALPVQDFNILQVSTPCSFGHHMLCNFIAESLEVDLDRLWNRTVRNELQIFALRWGAAAQIGTRESISYPFARHDEGSRRRWLALITSLRLHTLVLWKYTCVIFIHWLFVFVWPRPRRRIYCYLEFRLVLHLPAFILRFWYTQLIFQSL